MNQQNNDLHDRWVELRNQHVKDVKQFQANLQNTELVFWASEEKTKLSARRNWLDEAVRAANGHRRVIRTVLNVRGEDICQVNVFCLYTMGTKKKKLLDAIKRNLPSMKGFVLIFYPHLAKKLHRTNSTNAADFFTRRSQWRGERRFRDGC